MELFNFNQQINWLYVAIVLLIGIIIFLLLKENISTPNALLLNTEKFNHNPIEIILYYASWCGYSQQILPEWEKFKVYAEENLKHINVKTIKCDDNDKICSIKEVSGYPTIILCLNDNKIVFNEERKMEKIVEFINKNCK